MLRRCSVDEAVALLRSPDAVEELSLAHGCAALVVEADAGEPWPDDALSAEQHRTLEWLPCVTVAPTDGRTWRHFDVVAAADDADGREALLAGVTAHPQAGLGLVRLLRAAHRSDPRTALWAESVAYGLLQAGPEFETWRSAAPEAPPGPPGDVRVEREHAAATVVLDRPGRHNALDRSLRDGLVDALRAVAADPEVTQVCLRGEGPSFCSGGDLAEFGTFPDPVAAHVIRSTRLPAQALLPVRNRLRAEVHGACVGAGVELAAFAADVVAHPGTTFRLPEVQMGLVPGSGGTWSVNHRIGSQRTAWLALTGAPIDVHTALAWGLVDRIS